MINQKSAEYCFSRTRYSRYPKETLRGFRRARVPSLELSSDQYPFTRRAMTFVAFSC